MGDHAAAGIRQALLLGLDGGSVSLKLHEDSHAGKPCRIPQERHIGVADVVSDEAGDEAGRVLLPGVAAPFADAFEEMVKRSSLQLISRKELLGPAGTTDDAIGRFRHIRWRFPLIVGICIVRTARDALG